MPGALEGLFRSSLAAALLNGLFEHLAWRALIVSDVQANQIPMYQQNFPTDC
jgi:hypothetical protein